ncbi:MAG: hypothetical protein M3Y87_06530 [Myxococcota bacterium]|nr:hypothetical protein [Myxococcota bacterium]
MHGPQLVVLAAICASAVVSLLVIAAIVVAIVTYVRRRARRAADRWSTLAAELGLRVARAAPWGRLEGWHEGLAVALEEHDVPMPSRGDAALVVASLALGQAPASAGPETTTVVRAAISPPLPFFLRAVHVRSIVRWPTAPAAARPVPGASNPIADAVHLVESDDLDRAQSVLAALRARGGLVDLENGAWVASFDAGEVVLERPGSAAAAAFAEDGLRRAAALVARVRAESTDA